MQHLIILSVISVAQCKGNPWIHGDSQRSDADGESSGKREKVMNLHSAKRDDSTTEPVSDFVKLTYCSDKIQDQSLDFKSANQRFFPGYNFF